MAPEAEAQWRRSARKKRIGINRPFAALSTIVVERT